MLDQEGNGCLKGVGSGSRYLVGALLLQNNVKPLSTWSKEEAITWIKSNFRSVIDLDLASSTTWGLHIRVIYKDNRKSEFYSF